MASWADIRTSARRTVHQTFAVPIVYYVVGSKTPLDTTLLGSALTARLQNKVQVAPDAVGGGYSQILEGVTRVFFNQEDLQVLGLVPAKGDRVFFVDYSHTYRLDNKETPNGPINQKWAVSFVGVRSP